MKKNIYPYQLELPFTKCTYKNNINTLIVSELETTLNQNIQSKGHQNWLDPFLPTKNWDKRPKKKFYAIVWVNDHELEILKVYATSEMVAKKYLNENFYLDNKVIFVNVNLDAIFEYTKRKFLSNFSKYNTRRDIQLSCITNTIIFSSSRPSERNHQYKLHISFNPNYTNNAFEILFESAAGYT